MNPLPGFKREQLQGVMDRYLRARMQLDPQLSAVASKLEELLKGQSFIGEEVWHCPSDAEGLSLAEWHRLRPLGGISGTVAERWKANFTTKRQRSTLSRPNIAAFANNYNQNVPQRHIGTPRPPSLRDPKSTRSSDQVRAALLKHAVSVLEHGMVRMVSQQEFAADPGGVVSMFSHYKPGDEFKIEADPRFVTNLVEVNKPIQRVHKSRKFRGGCAELRNQVQQNDLAFCTDVEKGFNNVAQDRQMSRMQRHLIQCDIVEEALRLLDLPPPNPDRAVYNAKGQRCYVMEPLCLQFGHALSGELFQGRMSMLTGELAQEAHVRSVAQVDDLTVLSKHGPSALCADLLVVVATFEFCRLQLHLSAEKAEQPWPRAIFTFDGALHCPSYMQMFSIEAQELRHQTELREATAQLRLRSPKLTLRQCTRVVMQQSFHKRQHYPTGFLLPRPMRFLADEQRRSRRLHGPDAMWDASMTRAPKQCLQALEQLAEPKEVGQHYRPRGSVVATIVMDTGNDAVGFEVTDARTGKTTSGTLVLTAPERERHHAQQEGVGAATTVLGHVKSMDLNSGIVRVGSDNMATVANLNRPGSKPGMVEPLVELEKELRRRDLHVMSFHQGKYYMDVVSQCDWNGRRDLSSCEWQLNPAVLAEALLSLQVEVDLDLFASRTTRQVPAYVSRHPEPESAAVDALTLNWTTHPVLQDRSVYCFPPPLLLDRVAAKLEEQPLSMVLVFPLWENKPPCWPLLRARMTQAALVLPTTDLYLHPAGRDMPPDNVPRYPLIIASISGATKGWTEPQQPQPIICKKVLRTPSSNPLIGSWNLQTGTDALQRMCRSGAN